MTVLLVALVPALMVLYYYYNRDRHPEPWYCIALVFSLGGLSLFAILPLEAWAMRWLPITQTERGSVLFVGCMLIPGLIEETVKLLVVLSAIYWQRDFDEPVDGLIYATAAALGYTFAEDWHYYVVIGHDWTRAFGAIAQPWFSCFWGAGLGWAKFSPWKQGVPLVLVGLAASAFVHGLYDFFALAADAKESWHWLRFLIVPLLLFLYWALERHLEEMQVERAVNKSAGGAG